MKIQLPHMGLSSTDIFYDCPHVFILEIGCTQWKFLREYLVIGFCCSLHISFIKNWVLEKSFDLIRLTEPTMDWTRINHLLKSKPCNFPHENHLGCSLKIFFPDYIPEMKKLEYSGEKSSILGFSRETKLQEIYI